MIRLFEDKSEYISKSGTEKEPVFDIASDEKITIYLSWKSLSFDKVTLNIKGNGLVEIYELGESFNSNVEINIMENARVNHSIAFFGEDNNANYIVNSKENSEYQGALADFTKGKNKLNFVCNLNEKYAKAKWNLASLACEKDIKDFYVSFYHYAKNTYAKMENYGVCEDDASLSFLGTSSITRGAKTSATHQSAKIMVFDPTCKAKASPILCIDENDVEASHAAVVGQINEDHIFYLTSRGIEEEEAKKLITLGYLKPILRFFENEKDILSKLEKSIEGRF